jgi:hypothetical protein
MTRRLRGATERQLERATSHFFDIRQRSLREFTPDRDRDR